MAKRFCSHCSIVVDGVQRDSIADGVCPRADEQGARPSECVLDDVAVNLPIPAKAWNLKRGETYGLRFDRRLTAETRAAVSDALAVYTAKTDIHFMILEDCSIVEAPEKQ